MKIINNITKAPITAGLMILRAGCYNFRSVGVFSKENPYNIVDFTAIDNRFVAATGNGMGKSTLYKHLLDYCLTGLNSVEGDVVDALINSTNKKQGMSTFIEVFCHGEYYRSVRGRGKMKAFDIYKLIEGGWQEIPNLPVSDRERQAYWYALLGLDKNTAEVIISNTISLGVERFKGLLSMKADERRKLLEPIFNVTIFSDLNKETKARKANTIIEQKQTLLEIVDLDTKVALANQSVEYVKQEQNTLQVAYKAHTEVLNEKVSKCVIDCNNALGLDTDGSRLHVSFEEDSEEITKSGFALKDKLDEDLASLGEFKIDESDSKLISLEASYLSVDYEIDVAKKQLKEKESSLGEEVNNKISRLKVSIAERKVTHNLSLESIENGYSADSSAVEKQIVEKIAISEKEKTLLECLKEKLASSEEAHSDVSILLEDAKCKSVKYKNNISKMQDAVNYLLNKKAVEDNALKLLDHAGKCTSCLQEVTEEYLIEARKDVQERLEKLQMELGIYYDRISKGEITIEKLDIIGLEGKSENALYSVASNTTAAGDSEKLLNNYTLDLERLTTMQANITSKYVQDKKDSALEFNNDTLILTSKLDSVEHEVTKTIGSYQAKLDQLTSTATSRKDTLLQQIEDRKQSMKGEWGGKEKQFNTVYNIEAGVLDSKLDNLKEVLEKDLNLLISNKAKQVELSKSNLQSAEAAVTFEVEANAIKESALTGKLLKATNKLGGLQDKLDTLNALHNKLEQDVIDWNHLLQLISDDEGKAEVLKNFMPDFNKDINYYLNEMELFLDVTVDEKFGITMSTENRDGQTLHSLSVGQKCRVNLSIVLALRKMSTRLSGVECNVLILDEVLNGFHEDEVPLVIEMLKNEFSDLSLVVISQNKSSYSEHFDEVKTYSLINGFTKEMNED